MLFVHSIVYVQAVSKELARSNNYYVFNVIKIDSILALVGSNPQLNGCIDLFIVVASLINSF